MSNDYFVHPQGIVEPGAIIGSRTRIWAWAHVLDNVKIGEDCNLCDHTFIENGVVIGDRVTVKCNVYIPEWLVHKASLEPVYSRLGHMCHKHWRPHMIAIPDIAPQSSSASCRWP